MCRALADVFETPPCPIIDASSANSPLFIRGVSPALLRAGETAPSLDLEPLDVPNWVAVDFDATVSNRLMSIAGTMPGIDSAANTLVYWTANAMCNVPSPSPPAPVQFFWGPYFNNAGAPSPRAGNGAIAGGGTAAVAGLQPCLQRTFFTNNRWFGECHLSAAGLAGRAEAAHITQRSAVHRRIKFSLLRSPLAPICVSERAACRTAVCLPEIIEARV